MVEPAAGAERHPGGPLLWASVVSGIVNWLIHLIGMAALVTYVCSSGDAWLYHALGAVTALGTIAAFPICWRAWRSDEGEGGVAFMGALGVLLNGIFLWAILAEWVPVFVIGTC